MGKAVAGMMLVVASIWFGNRAVDGVMTAHTTHADRVASAVVAR